jgi:NAD(P)-dependent dehydrogenase (short-subunit alcohol dehydrogenase family)
MGKTALITGGSSGLGLAYAEILGQQGYRIIILARNQERIELAVKLLSEKGIRAEGISVDVTDEKQMAEAATKVKILSKSLDFMILNAGEVTPRLLCDYTSPKELKKDIDIDLWGVMLSAWNFTPLLPDGSKILMTSSGLGLMGAAGYAPYCAAKAGIINFAESIRRELLFRKIGVYVACPGDLDTPQFENEIADQPVWMKDKGYPRKALSAPLVAQSILKKCKGHSRLLILPDPTVKLLNFVLKILPRSWSRLLLDHMVPRPH